MKVIVEPEEKGTSDGEGVVECEKEKDYRV